MIQVDDRVKYMNVLGEWHEGKVLRVNKATIRIANTRNCKVLSIRKNLVKKVDGNVTV